MKSNNLVIASIFTVLLSVTLNAQSPVPAELHATELRRFPAAEARQGIAADGRFVYAIDNRAIGKYDKITGDRVAGWEGPEGGPIQHLDGGVIRNGRLYAAHSNYPNIPMVSSIEVFEIETLRHIESHSFGIHSGSATWVDYQNGAWWVAFANYETTGGVPGRGVEWTTLERFDEEWRQTGGWSYPETLVRKFRPFSNSGGVWTGGVLWLTGHDAAEVYITRLPQSGSTLEWVGTIAAPLQGQGIAVDPIYPKVLYGIDRGSREVIVMEVR